MWLSLVILAGSMLSWSSCARRPDTFVIDGTDIYKGKADGDVCFGKFYLDNVVQAKIENSKNVH